MKFSIKGFFNNLLKKSLMENLIFCEVYVLMYIQSSKLHDKVQGKKVFKTNILSFH